MQLHIFSRSQKVYFRLYYEKKTAFCLKKWCFMEPQNLRFRLKWGGFFRRKSAKMECFSNLGTSVVYALVGGSSIYIIADNKRPGFGYQLKCRLSCFLNISNYKNECKLYHHILWITVYHSIIYIKDIIHEYSNHLSKFNKYVNITYPSLLLVWDTKHTTIQVKQAAFNEYTHKYKYIYI